jgi:hypothetical protein
MMVTCNGEPLAWPEGAGPVWLEVAEGKGTSVVMVPDRIPGPWAQPVVKANDIPAVASKAARLSVMISPPISAVPDKHAQKCTSSDTGTPTRFPQEFHGLII